MHLSVALGEVNTYGSGRVNMYQLIDYSYYQKPSERNGYGGMAYYNSDTCGYSDPYNYYSFNFSGCTNDYNTSDIKYVLDNWERNKYNQNQLKNIDGYTSRLINIDDYHNISSYSWVHGDYWYWTMIPYENMYMQCVNMTGSIEFGDWVYVGDRGMIRPVINIYKSELQS